MLLYLTTLALMSACLLRCAVAQQLQEISSLLGLDLNIVIPLVARHEPLLLQPAHQLPARLSLLSSALQLPPADTAQLLSASAPQLLGTSFTKLQTNLLQLGRVLSSRGLKPAEVLQARPDLLTQNPGSVEAKLEQLPGALGMSRQRVRQLISQCPDLLRRSVATIAHRWAAVGCGWAEYGTLCIQILVCWELGCSAGLHLPTCDCHAVQLVRCSTSPLNCPSSFFATLIMRVRTVVLHCPAGTTPCVSCSASPTALLRSLWSRSLSCCA